MSSTIKADRLPVKDRSGEVLFYVAPATALDMISRGVVLPVGTKHTIRGLRVSPKYDDSKVISLAAYVGQRYSHSHETRDNPEGCWTLKRLSRSVRPVFTQVIADCIQKAA